MTGHELEIYLSTLSIIEPLGSRYLTELINGIEKEVPSYYRTLNKGLKVEVELISYSNQLDTYIDFTLGGGNLYCSYKLGYLTLPKLIEQLGKVIDGFPEFEEWSKIELRNYKIIKLLNE